MGVEGIIRKEARVVFYGFISRDMLHWSLCARLWPSLWSWSNILASSTVLDKLVSLFCADVFFFLYILNMNLSLFLPAAVPSHGEPAVLPRAQDVPVCALRSGVYRVRPDDSALSPPLPAGQEWLLQADGHVWCELAAGDGLQQVSTTAVTLVSWL